MMIYFAAENYPSTKSFYFFIKGERSNLYFLMIKRSFDFFRLLDIFMFLKTCSFRRSTLFDTHKIIFKLKTIPMSSKLAEYH